MHLSREMLLRNDCSNLNIPLTILRPSLLYGVEDPHNGYGPNQFFRLANKGQSIVLFGEGEELRDHVYIEDVAEIASRVIDKGMTGIFNIATGQVFSFRDVAEKIKKLVDPYIKIEFLPRSGPMPHNGYRSFDTSLIQSIFTDFSYTPLFDGFLLMQDQMKETSCVTN
jgi:UDP-glucose 4-epimerase